MAYLKLINVFVFVFLQTEKLWTKNMPFNQKGEIEKHDRKSAAVQEKSQKDFISLPIFAPNPQERCKKSLVLWGREAVHILIYMPQYVKDGLKKSKEHKHELRLPLFCKYL